MVISGSVSDRFGSHLYPCVTDVAEQHFVENAHIAAYNKYNAKGWWGLLSLVSIAQDGKQQQEQGKVMVTVGVG